MSYLWHEKCDVCRYTQNLATFYQTHLKYCGNHRCFSSFIPQDGTYLRAYLQSVNHFGQIY